jgi:hypothetical protein
VTGGETSAAASPSLHETPGGAIPLADCIDTFFDASAQVVPLEPVLTAPDAILDQVPEVDVAVRGVAVTEALRPIYRAFRTWPG